MHGVTPIIFGTAKDRTGAASILRKASAEIQRRYAGLTKDVLALFDGIRVYGANRDEELIVYGLTPEEMSALYAELARAFERWIASGKERADLAWWSAYVQDAQQMGTAQSVANLAALSEAYKAARAIETVIYSTPYKVRLGVAQLKSYEHWTGMAASQKAELAQIIGRAVVDGKNPKAVRREIAERLDVSMSRAMTYAQTDITDTLRQARWAEAEHAQRELGLKVGILWTSAFKPTTRQTHASRSGHVYSTEEVRAFYNRDGNRYNCLCGQTECLLDDAGKPILTDKLKDSMKNERKTWQSRYGA